MSMLTTPVNEGPGYHSCMAAPAACGQPVKGKGQRTSPPDDPELSYNLISPTSWGMYANLVEEGGTGDFALYDPAYYGDHDPRNQDLVLQPKLTGEHRPYTHAAGSPRTSR